MALARGAALASANAHLGAPSTAALPDVGPGAPAESGSAELAYSAVADDDAGAARESEPDPGVRRSRKALVAIATAVVVFVGGTIALALALAFGIRPHVEQRPDIGKSVVAPAPAPPPSAGPAPETAAPPKAPDSPPQDSSTRTRDRVDDWLHRHIGRGIPGS